MSLKISHEASSVVRHNVSLLNSPALSLPVWIPNQLSFPGMKRSQIIAVLFFQAPQNSVICVSCNFAQTLFLSPQWHSVTVRAIWKLIEQLLFLEAEETDLFWWAEEVLRGGGRAFQTAQRETEVDPLSWTFATIHWNGQSKTYFDLPVSNESQIKSISHHWV